MTTFVVTDTGGWTELGSGDLPSSGVTPGTYGDPTHVGQFTVGTDGLLTAAANVAITGGGGGGTDGWTTDSNTWTYASFSAGPPAVGTFTVGTTDLTAQFGVGTRLRMTQTTTKYFVVTGSTFGGGTTTVSITGGTDYTLANAAITSPSYSYESNPQGFPGWFSFATGATGFSALTSDTGQFTVNGRTCFVIPNILGTSNSTAFTWLAPITAAGPVNALSPGAATNTSTTILARLIISSGSTTVTMALATVFGSNIAMGPGAWTASGTKGCVGATVLVYQV